MRTDGIMTVDVEVRHSYSGHGSVGFESVYRGFESLLPSLKQEQGRSPVLPSAPRIVNWEN
jgi:hypothetical protein